MIRALPALALTACVGFGKLDTDAPYPESAPLPGDGADAGGDGVAFDDSGDSGPSIAAVDIELSGACGEAATEDFTCVYADALVTCTHTGFVAAACEAWTAEATIDEDALTVQVDYTNDAASGCADTCPWDFSYALPTLASGDWSIQAGATDTGSGASSQIRTTITVP